MIDARHPDARWPEESALRPLVGLALGEDIGSGDRTTEVTVRADLRGRGVVLAKQEGILSGLPLVGLVYQVLDPRVRVEPRRRDGDRVPAGTAVCTIEGPFRSLLTGERVALNFLCHLSGVATFTARFVDAIAGTGACIVDTRKTTPGFRDLEKYAVRCGGGVNHRRGLDDAILIKDNHAAAAGGVGPAVRAAIGATELPVQVEVRTEDEIREAHAAGARSLLLDNMSPEVAARACRLARTLGGPVTIEVSGGLSLDSVRAYAEAGVDRLSIGALTHSAPVLDLSMELEAVS